MFPAFIGPQFYPFIFHKTPQYLNKIQFRRIGGQVKNLYIFVLPFSKLCCKFFACVERGLIHNYDSFLVYILTKILYTCNNHFAIYFSFNRVCL